jgi:hypothetical protein
MNELVVEKWVCVECRRSFRHWWRLNRKGVCDACYERRRRKLHRHKQRTCAVCGVGFTTTRSDSRFCSNACRQAAHRKRGKAHIGRKGLFAAVSS